MQLYWPEPTSPGEIYDCLECGTAIDGVTVEGFWLERENWQAPNTHELYCCACCVEKMNAWPNQPDVDDEADVLAAFS
ncbi:hypothetical protein [Halosolutus halophilus]|uniref:hypothetical protein n=1 Tax=Halosolutus halophilus TaxID=1552990 RepID=UPI002234FB65|nr:hypothetical protein [Halosolutus halophilus]